MALWQLSVTAVPVSIVVLNAPMPPGFSEYNVWEASQASVFNAVLQVFHMAWIWPVATCQARVTTSLWSSPHTSWQEASCVNQGYSL